MIFFTCLLNTFNAEVLFRMSVNKTKMCLFSEMDNSDQMKIHRNYSKIRHHFFVSNF